MSPAVYYLVHFLPVLAFPFWLFFAIGMLAGLMASAVSRLIMPSPTW